MFPHFTIFWSLRTNTTERSDRMKIGSKVIFQKGLKTSRIGVYHFFGVKRKSYAGSIVKRIYDYFCGGSKSLYLEYLIYYRKEYSSFKEFLVDKYNLFEPEVDKIISWRLFCKDLSFTPDTNINDFLEDDNMGKAIIKWLGENTDED